jgi:hypothetical protein
VPFFFDFTSKVFPTFFLQLFESGRRLIRQSQVDLVQQKLKFLLRLGVARQDQVASVGRRQVYVDHLHGFELFEDGAGCQARRVGFGSSLQGDLQAVAQERYEDVRLDPRVFPVIDRTDIQIVLELFENLFNFGQHDAKTGKMHICLL